MNNYSVVLSDSLLKEFFKFKHNEDCKNDVILKLLTLYKPSYITNVAQLRRVGICEPALLKQLASQSWANDTIEELIRYTKFKLILTDENSCIFPKINILDTNLESNYTSTFYKTDNRDILKEHIKLLCENSTNIFIYDKYFNSNWSLTKKLFDLMPRKNLTFFYKENQLKQYQITEIKRIHRGWDVRGDLSNSIYQNLHDRYLIIDQKIEIIFTSGFDNIFQLGKDLTYIVREKL